MKFAKFYLSFCLILCLLLNFSNFAQRDLIQASSLPLNTASFQEPNLDTKVALQNSPPTPLQHEKDQNSLRTNLSLNFKIDFYSNSGCAIEAERTSILFDQNAREKQYIPCANKLMILLLAAENLNLPKKINLPHDLGSEADILDGHVDLTKNSIQSLHYYFLRALFFDSNIAFHVLAEELEPDPTLLLKKMNQRAQALNLKNTNFSSVLEDFAYDTEDTDLSPLNNAVSPISKEQSSTLEDISLLLLNACKNKTFFDLFTTEKAIFSNRNQKIFNLKNPYEPLMNSTEAKIEGAYICHSKGHSFAITYGHFNQINMVTIISNQDVKVLLEDTIALYTACENYYEKSALVTAGAKFSDAIETTTTDEMFGLVFLHTLNYVHPKHDPFLKNKVNYYSSAPHFKPIQMGIPLGKVAFILKDDSLIITSVGSDKQIISDSTFISLTLTELQENKNLAILIFITFFIIIVYLIYSIIRYILLILTCLKMIYFEKKNRL